MSCKTAKALLKKYFSVMEHHSTCGYISVVSGGIHLMSPAPRGHGKVRRSQLLIVRILFIKVNQLKEQKKMKCYIQLLQEIKIKNYKSKSRLIQEHNRLSKEGLF